MDGEAHINAALAERVEELANLVLSLRYRHAVAGNDHHLVGGGQDGGGFFGGGAAYWASFLGGRRCALHLAEGSEQNVGERPVHSLRHDDREDKARRAIEGTGD